MPAEKYKVPKKLIKEDMTTNGAATFTAWDMREAFFAWIDEREGNKFSYNIITSCMEKTSEYAMEKNIFSKTLWLITDYRVFEEIYNIIIARKMFWFNNRKTYNNFKKVGLLYLQFLKNKRHLEYPNDLPIDTLKEDYVESEPSIKDILTNHFKNGFRIDSPIEMNRLRRFSRNNYGRELMMSDETLRAEIIKVGIHFGGKVYLVSEQAKESIKSSVFSTFDSGYGMIFYKAFFDKYESWLLNNGVVSADMLKNVLETLFPNCIFKQSYFAMNADATIEGEIKKCFEHNTLLNYEHLNDMLPYIPIDTIKLSLSQNGDFIWNSVGFYTEVSKIDITEGEKQEIENIAALKCNENGYLSLADIPINKISERNSELSVSAIHNAIFRVCLDGNYERRGKIVTLKGVKMDAFDITKKHCRSLERCTLDELLTFERELTGEVHHWVSMEAAYAVMVRIDATNFVARKYVKFDVTAIDAILDEFCPEDYLPLRSVTTFAAFPHVGQVWTLFLLESYVRRFSEKFRFEVLSVNSKNCGAIVCKRCDKNYREIMTDAVVKSDVKLSKKEVLEFLCSSGYIGKRSLSGIDTLLSQAKLTRERGR